MYIETVTLGGVDFRVAKDDFGTATKDGCAPNGFRIHVCNMETYEQYDGNFYCGSYYGSSEEIEAGVIIEGLISDAMVFVDYDDIDDMANELGCESISSALELWRMCEKTYEEMVRVFGSEEQMLDALVQLTA